MTGAECGPPVRLARASCRARFLLFFGGIPPDRHRLTGVADSEFGSITYTWDVEGRLTGRTAGGVNRTFAWDSRDRLTSVSEAGASVATYAYGESGLKLSSSWPGTPLADREYVWEGRELLGEYDGTGSELRARIIRGMGRDLLAAVTKFPAQGEALHQLHNDALGSPILETGAAGSPAARGGRYPPSRALRASNPKDRGSAGAKGEH